eukprot:scaffold2298_cov104-Skeletonema_dohrnii-CCMP3373.AAC.6
MYHTAQCGREMYDVALYTAPRPHFFFLGTISSESTSSTSEIISNCPKTLAFGSSQGRKANRLSIHIYVKDMDTETLLKHNLRAATLYDVLKADENAAAIDDCKQHLAFS